MRVPRKLLRLALAGVVVAATVVPATTSSALFFPLDPKVENAIQHILECKRWLINNPALWQRNCQPSRTAGVSEGPSPNMTNPWTPPQQVEKPDCIPFPWEEYFQTTTESSQQPEYPEIPWCESPS